MNLKSHLYNPAFQKPTFIYQKGTEALPEFKGEKFQEEIEQKMIFKIPDLSKKSPEEAADFVEQFLKDKVDYDQIKNEIRAHVEKYAPENTEPEVIDRLARDTTERLRIKIEAAKVNFYKKLEERIIEYENLNEKITDATKNGLKMLRQAVEKLRGTLNMPKIEKAAPKAESWLTSVPIIGPIGDSIPILSYIFAPSKFREYRKFRNQMETSFGAFVDKLNAQYLNLEWQKEGLTEAQIDRYEKLAGDKLLTDGFKDNMKNYVKNQIEFIFVNSREPEILKKRLEGLRDNLVERYKKYSRDDGIIDLDDLEYMRKESGRYLKVIEMINSGKSIEEIAKKAEFKEFFNRERWVETTQVLTKQLIKDAKDNGSEAAFTEAVMDMMDDTREKELLKDRLKNADGSEERMEEAGEAFEKIMAKRADAGITETLEAVKKFNEAVNGGPESGRTEILSLSFIRKESIHPLVRREREFLLGEINIPENLDDKMVVEFMQGNRENRDRWLAQPARRTALFLAIKNVIDRLEGQKNKKSKLKTKISSLPGKLTSWKGRPDKRPTAHDRLARALAMVTLAKEAKWVIENLGSAADYKTAGLNLAEELENTDPEANAPGENYSFRNVNKLHSTRFISNVSRGGFNGRDILLNAGKIWAGATIFLNLMNARRAGKLGAFLTNPYIYAAAGAMWGIQKYQENPEVKNYLFEDAGGQVRIREHLALNSLGRKAGFDKVRTFINPDNNEFDVMEQVMKKGKEGVTAVKELRKKVRKRYAPYPVITKKDLRELVDNEIITERAWSQLPDRGNNRMRYLFYEKFLTSEDVSIRNLKENCSTWK